MHKRRRRPATGFFCLILFSLLISALLISLAGKKDPPKPIVYSSHPENDASPGVSSGATAAEHSPGTTPTAPVASHSPDELPEQPRKLYDRIPEARDFALGCLDPHDEPKPEDIDLSDLDLTSVPDLHQWDERWGYAKYAGNFFGLSGCGPTCLSMAAMYLTGDRSLNPLYVARYAEENGYSYDGKGTAWALFTDGASGLGLRSRELPLVQSMIDLSLDRGGLVALVLGPGDFTDSGHFILIVGRTDAGYIIRDPNCPQNTAQTWTYSRLQPQIHDLWSLDKL